MCIQYVQVLLVNNLILDMYVCMYVCYYVNASHLSDNMYSNVNKLEDCIHLHNYVCIYSYVYTVLCAKMFY